MKVHNIKLIKNNKFSANVDIGFATLKIEGNFKTSHQEYPEDKNQDPYVSTLEYKSADGLNYIEKLSHAKAGKLNDLITDQLDSLLKIKG